MLWLLAFSIFAVFSLCPLAGLATRYNLTAGGPSDGTFYVNAPVFVAGDSARNETTGSANINTGVLNDTAKNHALFKTDGTVNTTVLKDLLSMLDDNKVKENPIGTSDVKYYSAKNFGKYGTQNDWKNAQRGNTQILVKLFDTAGDANSNINNFTSQYWQAVYRSINGENDVLTLYMVRSYLTDKIFDEDSGNYSKSAIRNGILGDYTTLKGKFSQADQYIVAPYQLSSSGASDMSKTPVENGRYLNLGGWQSSAYQTSAPGVISDIPLIIQNNEWMSGTTAEIHTGASGYYSTSDTYSSNYYAVNNGLDGLGDGWKGWTSINSNYTDKLWLPSEFEVLHTGFEPTKGGTLSRYDGVNDIIYLDSNYDKATAGINSKANISAHTNVNRTGLWELNGYDRASNNTVWLRSSGSDSDFNACIVDHMGDLGTDSADDYQVTGVRVALHLNLGELKSLLTTRLNITATNNAVNSLLVLTIMDGDARLAEYSCISGTITPQITLDWNKTYKILATRPFGSSLEVKLDDDLQSPTVFACYEISTAENVRMNISFTLTGDGSWKNCVVI